MNEQSSKFNIWKWTLLGALYGALPVPLLFLYGDVSAALVDGGTWASIRPGAFREWRNLFVILFIAATLPAYLVGRIYERRTKRGQLRSAKQRLMVILWGAVIAAAPMAVIAPLGSMSIDYFQGEETTVADVIYGAMLYLAILGTPAAILGGFATGLLVINDKTLWK